MSSRQIVDLRNKKPTPRHIFFRSPEKRPTLRARRRKTRALIALAIIVLLCALAWGAHAISGLAQFTIQEIHVIGTHRVSAEQVSEHANAILDDEAFHFFNRRNIFRYSKEEIRAALTEEFPRIASASLSRDAAFSTVLTINIVERQPYGRWCMDPTEALGSCFLMDTSGFIFASASDPAEVPSTDYVFVGGSRNVSAIGKTFAPEHLPGIITLLALLENAGFDPAGASIQNEQDFFVPLRVGFFVKVSYGSDADQLVRNLQLILSSGALRGKESEIEYIDLRFGNRVYYKLKGEAEAPVE